MLLGDDPEDLASDLLMNGLIREASVCVCVCVCVCISMSTCGLGEGHSSLVLPTCTL